MTKLQIMLLKDNVPIEHIKNDIKRKKESFYIQNVLNFTKSSWKKKYQNFSDYLNTEDSFGNTALIYALRTKNIEKIKIILKEDPKIDYSMILQKTDFIDGFSKEIHKILASTESYFTSIQKLKSLVIKNNYNKETTIVKILKELDPEISLLYLKEIEKLCYYLYGQYDNDYSKKKLKDFRKLLNSRNIKGETILNVAINKNLGKEHIFLLYNLGVDINKKYTSRLAKGKNIEYKYGRSKIPFSLVSNKTIEKISFDTKNTMTEEKIEDLNIIKKKKGIYKYDEYPIHHALKKGSIKTLDALLMINGIKDKVKDKDGKTLEDKGYNKLYKEKENIISKYNQTLKTSIKDSKMIMEI